VPPDDATLRALREADLLHTYHMTQGRQSSQRPAADAEIVRLFLMKAPVTDEGLKTLAGLKSLQLLNVRGTRVTDQGVAELQKALPNLKVLR
jgi:hypothetical protein